MSASVIPFVAMADFPNRLNALRRERGMTQLELADMLGYSTMKISRLETGKVEMNLDEMRKIARVFGVAPVDLLNDTDVPDRLTDEERTLIYSYRSADPGTQENLRRVADALTGYRPEPSADERQKLAG